MGVAATPLTWTYRALWFVLPFTLGELMGDALTDHSSSVAWCGAVLGWSAWAVALGTSMVPAPATLTIVRILAPTPIVAGVVAAVVVAPDELPGALGWVGLVSAAVAVVCALAPEFGEWFVNGASYGDERRMPIRPPVPLLLGPIELVWTFTVFPVTVGAFLVAARNWVLGPLVLAIGVATVVIGFRILRRLADRWIVFVPAGITIVDDFAVNQPVLLPRARITRLGPAVVGTAALDLTANASGLVLQVDLDEPVELVPQVGRGDTARATTATSLLISATRPGELLDQAESRRIRVSR